MEVLARGDDPPEPPTPGGLRRGVSGTFRWGRRGFLRVCFGCGLWRLGFTFLSPGRFLVWGLWSWDPRVKAGRAHQRIARRRRHIGNYIEWGRRGRWQGTGGRPGAERRAGRPFWFWEA